jgi:hypothetical protein
MIVWSGNISAFEMQFDIGTAMASEPINNQQCRFAVLS